MFAISGKAGRCCRLGPIRNWLLALVMSTGLTVPLVNPAKAFPAPKDDAEEQADGLVVTVPHPLTANAEKGIEAKLTRLQRRIDQRRLKVLFDFNPGGQPSGTSDYSPCRDFADFLISLPNVTTVALVHQEVTRHTVLPVLACQEIVMAGDAKIGDVLRDQAEALKEDQRLFYQIVADRRRRCPAIVFKMIDKDMDVWEGTLNAAVWYIDKRRETEETKKGFVLTGREPVLAAGKAGLYSPAEAQRYTLCNTILRADAAARVSGREAARIYRQEAAGLYGLPARSLRDDPLEGRSPVAWRVVVSGELNATLREKLMRRMGRAVAKGANLLILQLECGGGSSEVAAELARTIRSLKDTRGQLPVMTIALLTDLARDNATFLALGCTEIVMEKDAKLGDFERVIQARPDFQDAVRKALEDLALEQGQPVLLARGMLDREVYIYRVKSQKGKFERKLIDGRELEEDKTGEHKWVDEGQIKAGGPEGQFLTLGADRALELGLAQLKVDGTSSEALKEMYNHYGLESVQEAGPDWLDAFADFLSEPGVSIALVMIGVIGLVLELKMPGIGVPGVIAAICFVLFFWAQSQLNGNLTMLAVLLFILGLILIGLEVFVIPGFGVTGISGILLVVVSLALATFARKPETVVDWVMFGAKIATFGASVAAAVAAAMVIARFLPHIPYANRLVLTPPGALAEVMEIDDPWSLGKHLGEIGQAATALRPAGKVRFGEELVDVVAEGTYVAEGSQVQVIQVEGNRIVVKEV